MIKLIKGMVYKIKAWYNNYCSESLEVYEMFWNIKNKKKINWFCKRRHKWL
jgi:hypothetical protein